jgi:hypothetical protein
MVCWYPRIWYNFACMSLTCIFITSDDTVRSRWQCKRVGSYWYHNKTETCIIHVAIHTQACKHESPHGQANTSIASSI